MFSGAREAHYLRSPAAIVRIDVTGAVRSADLAQLEEAIDHLIEGPVHQFGPFVGHGDINAPLIVVSIGFDDQAAPLHIANLAVSR